MAIFDRGRRWVFTIFPCEKMFELFPFERAEFPMFDFLLVPHSLPTTKYLSADWWNNEQGKERPPSKNVAPYVLTLFSLHYKGSSLIIDILSPFNLLSIEQHHR